MTLATIAEAVFVSSLQPSDHPTFDQVLKAIRNSRQLHGGVCGCAAILAEEYGEHPETASDRMRWALTVAAECGAIAA